MQKKCYRRTVLFAKQNFSTLKQTSLFQQIFFDTLLTYLPSFFPGAECRREVVSTDDGISDDGGDSDIGGAAICVCKEGHTGDPDSEEGCKRDLVNDTNYFFGKN